jgi:hypothetical protein
MINQAAYSSLTAAIIAGLTFGGCGLFRPTVTLTPLGIVRAAPDELPGDIRGLTGEDGALRIDFHSRPELLDEEEDVQSISDQERFCDSPNKEERLFGLPSPFAAGSTFFWPDQRAEAKQRLLSKGHDPEAPVVYSIYIYIRQTEKLPSPGSSGHPGYDLAKIPRPLCVWINLYAGYEFSRATNTMTFSAAQVAAALGADK